ncbi:nitroreductase family protein [Variimorphobacter saccharofermentans]|nr:nitroreductase [Variimorphobacter saccharofermentans]
MASMDGDIRAHSMLDFIKSRRSTRRFKEKIVPEEILHQVIEAGRYAPSGGNSQSTHFIVIQKKQVLDKLADLAREEFAKMEIQENTYKSLVNSINASKKGNYVFHYNCPVLIITANKKDYGNNIADCACALENMMLMANALDLGSVWINQLRWLNENPVILNVMKELGLEEDERVYGALALGYPDTQDGLPVRTPLDRTGNIVTYI